MSITHLETENNKMDLHKALDCVIGTCAGAYFAWIGDHWMASLSVALVVWRAVQAFILEPLGIRWPPRFGWWRRK